MKKLLSWILIVVTGFACNKDSFIAPNPLSSLPISYTRYDGQNHRKIKEVFHYDANKNITSLSFLITDTLPDEILIDSGSYYFTFTDAGNPPSAYIYNYHMFSTNGSYDGGIRTENHIFYYNSDNRLIKDSGLYNMPTSYFSYSDNAIAYSTYIHDADSVVSYYRDTVLLDSRGMLAFNYQFNKNGAGWNIDTITYENNYLSNPFYIKTVSNSLGIFFLSQDLGDFISSELTTVSATYNWNVDNMDRVVSNSPGNGLIIQFTYP